MRRCVPFSFFFFVLSPVEVGALDGMLRKWPSFSSLESPSHFCNTTLCIPDVPKTPRQILPGGWRQTCFLRSLKLLKVLSVSLSPSVVLSLSFSLSLALSLSISISLCKPFFTISSESSFASLPASALAHVLRLSSRSCRQSFLEDVQP